MKKLIIAIALFASCSTPAPIASITAIESLPTGECIYTVTKDTITYTFIDEEGKYSVGENIK